MKKTTVLERGRGGPPVPQPRIVHAFVAHHIDKLSSTVEANPLNGAPLEYYFKA